MGVNGLWTVLQPCARPTNLATLNRKRLAVDASIWIYQFLKAVRDKEGNALRNSHVVGFFRRICKLLWFGIRPVFVFDGGAPALKRATLQGRRRRREGRREDAVRTAGKLLAVQMQRLAEEEAEKRQRGEQGDAEADGIVPGEALPSAGDIVYADEQHMSQTERQRSRRFHKQDAYHLPELENGIEAMGRPEDPRIMSIDELEAYARQFHEGEDINLYDFSKIDFDGEFFKSLPPPDRYNILNAARLRSRLRMGLSKDQLDDMFPDRMAFSKFQIERARERNYLTQRLMYEVGMTGTDWTVGVNARVAGEKDREYILVKNDGAEGGWALGVVSRDKDRGQMHKPIDVDALTFQYQAKDEDGESEDEDDFEDVPIEGLNRLPKARKHQPAPRPENDSMFVDADQTIGELIGRLEQDEEALFAADGEDEDLNRAIALSLQAQHNVAPFAVEDDEEEFEAGPAPRWTQKAVEAPKPITTASGKMVAHIVNNRANAAVAASRRRNSDSSDSDLDFGAALAAARRKKVAAGQSAVSAPIRPNVKNAFDGPLPFEKLNWRNSIFEKKPAEKPGPSEEAVELEHESDEEDLAGGFEPANQDDGPRPLPPWMVDQTDIRDSIQQQQATEIGMNVEDREFAADQERRQLKYGNAVIQIDSSDEGGSDVEILDAPPAPKQISVSPSPALAVGSLPAIHSESPPSESTGLVPEETGTQDVPIDIDDLADGGDDDEMQQLSIHEIDDGSTSGSNATQHLSLEASSDQEIENEAQELSQATPSVHEIEDDGASEIEFEDVELSIQPAARGKQLEPGLPSEGLPRPDDEMEVVSDPSVPRKQMDDQVTTGDDGLAFEGGDEFDDFSDPEEEELLAQMAEEAEEHARFASTLNHKSARENQESYERELKALRSQQKKDRRDADEVTQIMVSECQALLRLFGIPYITAPMEAEAQCAELVSLGLVDGIVTDDSDTFLFGGTRVYKNMFNGNKFVECYLGTDVEKELSLSRAQLIAMAQLLGSDYAEGLPGVGPVTAVEILSEFPGPSGLTEFREWWEDVQVRNRPKEADSTSPFRKKFRRAQAKKLFLPAGFPSEAVPEAYMHPEVDHSAEDFAWGVPDLDGLRTFLMATIGWSQERTDEVLVPVIQDMNRRETEGTQSNITRFFTGGVGVGVKEAFAPRQKGKSSKRMALAVDRLRARIGGVEVVQGESIGESSTSAAPAPAVRGRKRKARAPVVVEDDDEDEASVAGDAAGAAQGRSNDRGKGKKAKATSP